VTFSGTPSGTGDHQVQTPLGQLTRQGNRWQGSVSLGGRPLDLVLQPGPSATLDQLVSLVQRSLQHLDDVARRAQHFAFARERQVPPGLQLCALEASAPDPEWLRRHRLAPEPMLILTFTIAGDRNVLDVIIQGTDPIAFEYH
jgi:hypothetical protein